MGDPAVGKEPYELFCEGTVVVIDDWRTMSVASHGKTKTRRTVKTDKGHEPEPQAFIAACRTGSASPIPWSSIDATTRATFAAEPAWIDGATIEL